MQKRKDNKNRVLKEGESQRKNGTYTYRFRTPDKVRHSVYAKTLEDLREKEKAIQTDLMNRKNYTHSSLTLNDYYEVWKDIKRGLKPNTQENYSYVYQKWVYGSFGKKRLIDIKRSDVKRFYNSLHEETHLTVAMIDSIHCVIHQVLSCAVDDDIISTNPSDSALRDLKKAFTSEKEKRKALTLEEVKILLHFVATSDTYAHWLPLLVVLLFTGMRIGEALGLTWKDIDFENQVIHVKRTLVYYAKGKKTIHRRCYYAINKPKTEAGIRDIPILPIVEWAFTEQKKYLSDFHMISASNIDGISDFIFLNRFNEVLNGGVINKALKRIVSLINGSYKEQISPTLSCHIFRHTFLSMANAVDMNFKAKQDIVGHRCQDVTNGVYTDTEFKFRLKQMSKLQPVIDITCKHLPQAYAQTYTQIMSTYEDL